MRCLECNKILNDDESCHKDEHGKYTDTCFACLFGEADMDDWDELVPLDEDILNLPINEINDF